MSSAPPPPYGSPPPQVARPPILAWWGIIPSLVFIALQVAFGWPHAKVRATSPQYALSYLMGGVLAGLLISFIIAWVVYLVSGRSQLSATITYTLLIGVFCLSVISQAKRGRQAGAPERPPAAASTPTSFGAFDFNIPAGWSNAGTAAGKAKAVIILNARTRPPADGVLRVEAGRPTLPTARQVAETFAADGGRVIPDPVSIDGVEGVRVETTSTDLSRPRHVVVVFKGDQAFLIMAAAANEVDVSAAFDDVLRTWRWNDVE